MVRTEHTNLQLSIDETSSKTAASLSFNFTQHQLVVIQVPYSLMLTQKSLQAKQQFSEIVKGNTSYDTSHQFKSNAR